MSVFLNNNFGFNKNINNKVSEGKPIISGKISNLPEYIAALKEGSVFKGEVLDVRSNAVKILLSGNNILNARMQEGVSLNIGDILNFRVESNTGASMIVKAMPEEKLGNGLNMLMSALESANVPVNERNIALVKELVENGQPIDKQTVKTLVSNLNSFSELDIKSTVNMFKHNIPITAENVFQYNNYVESNNKLIDNFTMITNDLVETLVDFQSENNPETMLKLADNILQTLTKDTNITLETLYNQYNNYNAQVSNETGDNVIANNNANINANTNASAGASANVKVDVNNEKNINVKTYKTMPSLNQLFNNDYKETIKEIIEKTIENTIKKSLLLDKSVFNKPENEIKDELKKYYKDIEKKFEGIIKLLENAGLEKSALYKNVNNIKSNLNFMNDLNNMALYVQIPVKFAESEAHGELYVMNRNKRKVNESDVLTAFLHLDMENLGATDVNIRLEKGQLTTKFSLEDVVSQDIVEEHLPQLKKRLEEKGYEATVLIEQVTEEIHKDNEKHLSTFEKVMELEESKNIIKRYTLDVRA